MNSIKLLQPVAVWEYFFEITQIPRPSKKETQMIQFLESFGLKRHLQTKIDKAGNVLISKPATSGYEDKPTIVLQAHMDMVCEKNSDTQFNFDTDPIQHYIEDDWVKARGTTLGGDNGIGMAMMLAILDSDSIVHPALECLFTVDEETGLTGAFALENDFLTAKVLINLDSEDDGVVFIGCAGGVDTTVSMNYSTVQTPENYFAFSVSVKGLCGGHSGDDIEKGRGNAIKIVNRFLWLINKKTDLRLVGFNGGNLRNAIAREAVAKVCVPWSEKENIRVLFNQYIADIENELADVEPKMKLTLESESIPELIIDKNSSDNIINALYGCPNGVIGMSRDMANLVETSTNLASVKMLADNSVLITTSQRSSTESLKYDIMQQVESVFALTGATITHGDGYPGWKPNLKSEILKTAQQSYVKLYGNEPQIRAIHAGLECGLFLEKYPFLDMISIGPQMAGVHSPDERLSISSTQNCWKWLVDILATNN